MEYPLYVQVLAGLAAVAVLVSWCVANRNLDSVWSSVALIFLAGGMIFALAHKYERMVTFWYAMSLLYSLISLGPRFISRATLGSIGCLLGALIFGILAVILGLLDLIWPIKRSFTGGMTRLQISWMDFSSLGSWALGLFLATFYFPLRDDMSLLCD